IWAAATEMERGAGPRHRSIHAILTAGCQEGSATHAKGGAIARAALQNSVGFLCSRQVNGLRALTHTIRLRVEGDLLAINEGAQTRSLDSGNVDENVLRAAIRR